MAQASGRMGRSESQAGKVQLETGDLIDDFERSAQTRKNAENSVMANLTEKGAWYHGIGQSTRLSVMVFEEGIWITPNDE